MKMIKNISSLSLTFFLLFLFVNSVFAQYELSKSDLFTYEKSEINWGLYYHANSERETLKTNISNFYQEQSTSAAKIQFKNRYWNFLDFKQERFEFNLEAGPLWGNGNVIDSTYAENNEADYSLFGLRSNLSVAYSNRYYYNNKNYTLVKVNAWARYDWYNQNSNGTSTDSSDIVTPIDGTTQQTKFRYGIQARAGWGIGRLNPMNHFMVADYILDNYYKGRNFSKTEVANFASEIGRLKHQRDIIAGHIPEIEAEQMQQFLNEKMFLEAPDFLNEDWGLGEFLPRFNGSRFEFGPFFEYYNREPDFIYGAYFLFENAKYCNYKWNRNFSAGINYNGYKRDDWILAEVNIGWSYFIKLKSNFDFGVKYVPGIQVNGVDDIGKLNHGVIPYFGYFTQLNSKTRISASASLRISEDEKLMLPGPEFSLTVYRSRY